MPVPSATSNWRDKSVKVRQFGAKALSVVAPPPALARAVGRKVRAFQRDSVNAPEHPHNAAHVAGRQSAERVIAQHSGTWCEMHKALIAPPTSEYAGNDAAHRQFVKHFDDGLQASFGWHLEKSRKEADAAQRKALEMDHQEMMRQLRRREPPPDHVRK